jgi:hypothetical protein
LHFCIFSVHPQKTLHYMQLHIQYSSEVYTYAIRLEKVRIW